MQLIKIKKALISVSDKTNLKEVLECLKTNNVEIISTGGSYKFIKDLGFKCTEISEYTKFPEILDGRLKTLHPKIHGRRSNHGRTTNVDIFYHYVNVCFF